MQEGRARPVVEGERGPMSKLPKRTDECRDNNSKREIGKERWVGDIDITSPVIQVPKFSFST